MKEWILIQSNGKKLCMELEVSITKWRTKKPKELLHGIKRKSRWSQKNLFHRVMECNGLNEAWLHNEGLLTPWTLKLSQGLVKFVIGCWTCPRTTLVYSKEKMSEWPYFKVYIIHWHGPTSFAVWEAKEVLWYKKFLKKEKKTHTHTHTHTRACGREMLL